MTSRAQNSCIFAALHVDQQYLLIFRTFKLDAQQLAAKFFTCRSLDLIFILYIYTIMDIKLEIPKEPQEVKKFMMSLEATGFNGPDIEWDPLIVWYGNKLPKYLWDQWKDKLKPTGFTWQKFMRLLHYRTDISVLWYKGLLPWDKFAEQVKELIEGPIGKGLVEPRQPK